MDEDQRLRTLERDLGRLEGVVESLVSSVRMEHETARAARADDRAALNELGERMERVVSNLAEEVKKLAQESAKQDVAISTKQATAEGAVGISRWILTTLLAVSAVIIGYRNNKDSILPSDYLPTVCPKESAEPPRIKS